MSQKMLFIDGFEIPAKQDFIDSLAPWRLSGKGLFETMKAHQGTILFLDEHLDRLSKGLGVLRLKMPYSKTEMEKYLYQSLESNQLRDARIRLTVWKEEAEIRISIVSLTYNAYPPEKYQTGFKATISNIVRDETSSLSRIKSIYYLPLLSAYHVAEKKGCDEAVLLNKRGDLVEGSRSNIFFVMDGEICTPALKCGCLNGITRQNVMKLARTTGFKAKAVTARPEDLLLADEAFFTNSLIEIMPLTMVQSQAIGDGRPGAVTTKLMAAYKELISKSLQ